MLDVDEQRLAIRRRGDAGDLALLRPDQEAAKLRPRRRADAGEVWSSLLAFFDERTATLEAAGVKNVNTYDAGYWPGMGIHEMGTARMGRVDDAQAVVDPELRVRDGRGGVVRGLRVVDASVMPTITSGNTNSPTLMLAEKAAQWLAHEALANP